MNLILCGMMGAGKTSVGRAIADLTGRVWYDTDDIIVKQYGPISEIFTSHGEEYFRALETETLRGLTAQDDLVISVGGGLVLRQENVDILRQNGKMIFLKATMETLVQRLRMDTERPLLHTEEDLKTRLEKLFSEREPIYERVADFTVKVDGKTPEEIGAEIMSIV
ncbi:MAG: shikimate kinase [Clostridiales bacterium]|nr:shikimate kinase [Clostridiales bacterium]